MLPSKWFMIPVLVLAALVAAWGQMAGGLPAWLLPLEVAASIAALFIGTSFRLQFPKNTVAYGSLLPVAATWAVGAWKTSRLPLLEWTGRFRPSWEMVEKLVHIETLLFIGGLSVFVAVFVQARVLESLSLRLMKRGRASATMLVIGMCAVVAVASGVLDGVSMVGLLLRAMAIIMLAAGCTAEQQRRSLVLACIVTTLCGAWLAYGEPPNMIMKASVRGEGGQHLLTDSFFLTLCAPAALISFAIVVLELFRVLGGGMMIEFIKLDIMVRNQATVRFMQTLLYGHDLTEAEVVRAALQAGILMPHFVQVVLGQLNAGIPLGLALRDTGVPKEVAVAVLIEYAGLGGCHLADHYYAQNEAARNAADGAFYVAILEPARQRLWARGWAVGGLVVFVGALLVHGIYHTIPLFVAPLLGAAVGVFGIIRHPNLLRLAARNAHHEAAEYAFLIPLFMGVGLMTMGAGFDALRQPFVTHTTAHPTASAVVQFLVCNGLSAVLDNNVVAAAGGGFLGGVLPLGVTFLSAMAQILGYALGGCLTNIGSAQSVITFGFIQANVKADYTPIGWIRDIASVGAKLTFAMAIYILIRGPL